MATRKPISLVKGDNNAAETWPDEPIRFTEEHVDPFLLWCVERDHQISRFNRIAVFIMKLAQNYIQGRIVRLIPQKLPHF